MYKGLLLLDSIFPIYSIISEKSNIFGSSSPSTNSLKDYAKSNISTTDTSCLALPNPFIEKN